MTRTGCYSIGLIVALSACGSSGTPPPAADASSVDAPRPADASPDAGPPDAALPPDISRDLGQPTRPPDLGDTPPAQDMTVDSVPAADTTVDAYVDPACRAKAVGIGQGDYSTRAVAKQIPFYHSMWIRGTMGPGSATGSSPMWFFFDVGAEQEVGVSFGGKKLYAAFYFENEQKSQFSVGWPKPSNSGTLKAGRYYVKVADLQPRYYGYGPTWELYLNWTVKPPPCNGP